MLCIIIIEVIKMFNHAYERNFYMNFFKNIFTITLVVLCGYLLYAAIPETTSTTEATNAPGILQVPAEITQATPEVPTPAPEIATPAIPTTPETSTAPAPTAEPETTSAPATPVIPESVAPTPTEEVAPITPDAIAPTPEATTVPSTENNEQAPLPVAAEPIPAQ
jgi:hypothetical protein